MNYRTERLPVVTLSLIGINTLVYLVQLIFAIATQGDSDDWVYGHLWLIPAISYPWMYVTHMFVHAGFFHIFGNMIFLFLFGSCVEDMIGRMRFTIYYLACGLIASFVFIALIPEHFQSEIPMGGASGAISACMGMYLMLRAKVEIEFRYFYWLIYFGAGEFEIPAWVAIGFYFLTDLWGAISDLMSPLDHGGVAAGALLGGLLAGVAFIAIHKKRAKAREEAVAGTTGRIIDAPALIVRTARVAVTNETPTIYLHDGTEQRGPFTLTQIQTMLGQGEINHEAQYWSEGMAEWQGVRDLAAHPIE